MSLSRNPIIISISISRWNYCESDSIEKNHLLYLFLANHGIKSILISLSRWSPETSYRVNLNGFSGEWDTMPMYFLTYQHPSIIVHSSTRLITSLLLSFSPSLHLIPLQFCSREKNKKKIIRRTELYWFHPTFPLYLPPTYEEVLRTNTKFFSQET